MWPGTPHGKTDPLWAERTLHGFDFFFADTRTERDGRCIGNMLPQDHEAKIRRHSVCSNGSGRATTNGGPGFVVSPSILLPRRLSVRDQAAVALHIDGRSTVRDQAAVALHIDSWCGYPASLYQVLAKLCEQDARRVVFLSGDEHVSCVATFEIERLDKRVSRSRRRSFGAQLRTLCAVPVRQFDQRRLRGRGGIRIRSHRARGRRPPPLPVHHNTWFPPPLNGYAILRPQENRDAGNWRLDIDFFQGGNDSVPYSVDLG